MGDKTDLTSNSNISKAVCVNIAFITAFFKEYLISFLMVCRLIFKYLKLCILMFKVCGIIGISKIKFFNFSGIERVNRDLRINSQLNLQKSMNLFRVFP